MATLEIATAKQGRKALVSSATGSYGRPLAILKTPVDRVLRAQRFKAKQRTLRNCLDVFRESEAKCSRSAGLKAACLSCS
jgi:hypothetical protein